MAIIIALNVLFAVLVVGGILALLGGGIVADKASAATPDARQLPTVRAPRQPAQRVGSALPHGA